MLKTTLQALLATLAIHFAIKTYQYSQAAKVSSIITRFQEERGYGRRSTSMDRAFVSYHYDGNFYEVPIRDAYLFEHKKTGTIVSLLINPAEPDKAVANGLLTFWLRMQVLAFMVLGGLILLALLGFVSIRKNEDEAFF